MKCYLACFDISDDRLRRRVGKLLGHYGERVQYSVFEVAFNRPSDLETLRERIKPMLEDGDDLRFYYLNSEARRYSHDCHQQPVADFPGAIIL